MLMNQHTAAAVTTRNTCVRRWSVVAPIQPLRALRRRARRPQRAPRSPRRPERERESPDNQQRASRPERAPPCPRSQIIRAAVAVVVSARGVGDTVETWRLQAGIVGCQRRRESLVSPVRSEQHIDRLPDGT